MKPFVEIKDKWAMELESSASSISKEVLLMFNNNQFDLEKLWASYYDQYVSGDKRQQWKWQTLTFRFLGIDQLHVHEQFPITSRAIRNIPELLTAEISFLFPGVRIAPHKGFSSMILRNHLPLKVPKGDTGIKVADQIHHWQKGRLVSFNDSLLHEAWNLTDELRVVLMFDIAQPGGEYSMDEICRYKLNQLENHPELLSIGSKKQWLEWYEQGYFS